MSSGKTGATETSTFTCTIFQQERKNLSLPILPPQKNPAISDGRIVWADGRIKGTNILAYDIATGQEKTVSAASEYETNPAISGSRIVWQDKRKGTMDIFMFTDESTDRGVAAGEKKGEADAKKAPLGIYPVAASIVAAYLILTIGKSKRRRI